MSRRTRTTGRSGSRSRSSPSSRREVKILGVYPAHPLRIAASARRTRRGLMLLIDARRAAPHRPRVFDAAGSAESEAEIIADHLIEANLRGHDSHGVGMIPNYLRNLGRRQRHAEPARDASSARTGRSIVYDGERGYGQIAAREATMLGDRQARRGERRRGRRAAQRRIISAGSAPMARCAPRPGWSRSISSTSPISGRPSRRGAAPTGASAPTRVCIAIPGPAPDRPIIARHGDEPSSRWAKCASRATRASR